MGETFCGLRHAIAAGGARNHHSPLTAPVGVGDKGSLHSLRETSGSDERSITRLVNQLPLRSFNAERSTDPTNVRSILVKSSLVLFGALALVSGFAVLGLRERFQFSRLTAMATYALIFLAGVVGVLVTLGVWNRRSSARKVR